ncbi:hypothetical protein [Bartonella quintana]|uniref:hypothetical protein n=1 Tax=Bartonella quintana TaxID=803 RepID=UPI0005500B55|nr:hypothetical protein [Bartonella quintana]
MPDKLPVTVLTGYLESGKLLFSITFSAKTAISSWIISTRPFFRSKERNSELFVKFFVMFEKNPIILENNLGKNA